MAAPAHYLGMVLEIADGDEETRAYFDWCARGEFRLQRCCGCRLIRYPATTGCPWCGDPASEWTPVEGKGTVHAYSEVHQAIQPGFKPHVPYHVLLVELDVQKGRPGPHEAIRVVGDLVTAEGAIAPLAAAQQVGIGSRVRMVFIKVSDQIALPQWTLDEAAEQPAAPWRFPAT